ncbi:MAG: hypothetical protein ACYDGR_04965 [Candidatus Dormibacteria bacterium]
MKYVKAVVSKVVGLFVADWTQTAGIALVLVLGYVAIHSLHLAGLGFAVAALLGLHLVYTTTAESRKRLAKLKPSTDDVAIAPREAIIG